MSSLGEWSRKQRFPEEQKTNKQTKHNKKTIKQPMSSISRWNGTENKRFPEEQKTTAQTKTKKQITNVIDLSEMKEEKHYLKGEVRNT